MDPQKGVIEYQNDHDLLIRVDEKLTGLHTKFDRLTDDHEERIRMLEREANRWIGRQSIIGGAIGATVSIVGSFIQSGRLP